MTTDYWTRETMARNTEIPFTSAFDWNRWWQEGGGDAKYPFTDVMAPDVNVKGWAQRAPETSSWTSSSPSKGTKTAGLNTGISPPTPAPAPSKTTAAAAPHEELGVPQSPFTDDTPSISTSPIAGGMGYGSQNDAPTAGFGYGSQNDAPAAGFGYGSQNNAPTAGFGYGSQNDAVTPGFGGMGYGSQNDAPPANFSPPANNGWMTDPRANIDGLPSLSAPPNGLLYGTPMASTLDPARGVTTSTQAAAERGLASMYGLRGPFSMARDPLGPPAPNQEEAETETTEDNPEAEPAAPSLTGVPSLDGALGRQAAAAAQAAARAAEEEAATPDQEAAGQEKGAPRSYTSAPFGIVDIQIDNRFFDDVSRAAEAVAKGVARDLTTSNPYPYSPQAPGWQPSNKPAPVDLGEITAEDAVRAVGRLLGYDEPDLPSDVPQTPTPSLSGPKSADAPQGTSMPGQQGPATARSDAVLGTLTAPETRGWSSRDKGSLDDAPNPFTGEPLDPAPSPFSSTAPNSAPAPGVSPATEDPDAAPGFDRSAPDVDADPDQAPDVGIDRSGLDPDPNDTPAPMPAVDAPPDVAPDPAADPVDGAPMASIAGPMGMAMSLTGFDMAAALSAALSDFGIGTDMGLGMDGVAGAFGGDGGFGGFGGDGSSTDGSPAGDGGGVAGGGGEGSSTDGSPAGDGGGVAGGGVGGGAAGGGGGGQSGSDGSDSDGGDSDGGSW